MSCKRSRLSCCWRWFMVLSSLQARWRASCRGAKKQEVSHPRTPCAPPGSEKGERIRPFFKERTSWRLSRVRVIVVSEHSSLTVKFSHWLFFFLGGVFTSSDFQGINLPFIFYVSCLGMKLSWVPNSWYLSSVYIGYHTVKLIMNIQ